MNEVFLKLLNMSAAGSVLILAVLALRIIFKKAPKAFICALWAIVAIRLICPFSIPSPVSVFGAAPTIISDSGEVELFRSAGRTEKAMVAVDTLQIESPRTEEETISEIPGTDLALTLRTRDAYLPPLMTVYAIGLGAMILYAAVSAILLRRRLAASVMTADGAYICDELKTPFIFGIASPKIYMPSGLDEEARRYVIAHERAHLQRLDHIWKPLGFLMLSVHWFNPLCYLAYALFCRDIELACDERVIRELNPVERAAYSQTLLNCSAHRLLAACPVAFGETGVKARVKAVLNYKKPAFWLIIVAVLAVAAVIVLFATKPMSGGTADRPFRMEENTERSGVSYPYLVRTGSAIWYLSAADMELLGEKAYLDGFEAILQCAEQDFADAREALSGVISDEVPPVKIYTDFTGRSEMAELSGAFYSTVDKSIRLFHGWDVASSAIVHEYVHYLTFDCCEKSISEGFYAEAVAEYVANFACHNDCARAAYATVSEEEKTVAKMRGIWDEAEDTVDLMKMYIGTAEFMRSEYSVGTRFSTVYGSPIDRTEQQLREPLYTTASYYEAGSMMCYMVERFGLEKIASVWDRSPGDMERDLGERYRDLYFEWAEWNAAKRTELGIASPDVGVN